jgi:hypothetical protein
MKRGRFHLIAAGCLAVVGVVLAAVRSPMCLVVFTGAFAAVLHWKAVKSGIVDV